MIKEEAIEVIEETIDDLCDGRILDLVPVRVSALEVAIEALKQTQWIPCEERLPEEDGQYLITVKYVHVDGYEDIYAEHGDWADGKWDMFCFGHCGKVESILAWMPLPKPYEGRTEE